jgi:hypothetical protein
VPKSTEGMASPFWSKVGLIDSRNNPGNSKALGKLEVLEASYVT